MKPYKAYKETGIDWLPRIPAHWKTERLKHCLSTSLQYGANASGIEYDEHLPRYIRITDILTPSELREDGKVSLPHHEAAPYILKNKDVLFARSGATAGKAFLYKTSTGDAAYAGYLIRAMTNPERLLPEFLLLVTQSVYYKEWTQSIFIQATIPNISAERYANLLLALPPLMEQHHIVLYLEALIAKIDQYITTKQKEISVLEEYKQTIINEAVTKGLDRAAQMKDSGIEWIGQMPAHWEVKRFRHIFDTFKGLNITKADLQETGIPVISYGQIHSKANQGTGIHEDLLRFVDESYLESDKKSLTQEHDFLFADTSEDVAGIGNCVYVNTSRPLFAGYHTIIARPHGIEFPRYLAFLFLSDAWRAQLRCIVNGVKVYSVNQKLLNQTNLLLPPVQEQKEIVAYLDGVCEKLTQTIQNINRQIELLNEYRTTLISDVVTGQVNVCESQ